MYHTNLRVETDSDQNEEENNSPELRGWELCQGVRVRHEYQPGTCNRNNSKLGIGSWTYTISLHTIGIRVARTFYKRFGETGRMAHLSNRKNEAKILQ